MSLFTKLTEFFLGKKEQPAVVAPPAVEPVAVAAPVKAAKPAKKSAPVLSFPKQEKAKAQPKKEAAKPVQTKKATDKVVTAPIVIAPRFNAIDLEKSSKNELLDLAREHGIKVNARMGKATIIAKLVK